MEIDTKAIRDKCDAGRTVRITDVKYLLAELDRLNKIASDYGVDIETMLTLAKSQIETAKENVRLAALAEKAESERDRAIHEVHRRCRPIEFVDGIAFYDCDNCEWHRAKGAENAND
jgi:hypothetical protein